MKINKIKTLDLISLFFILGYPKIPFIGVPLAVLILPFYINKILFFGKCHFKKIIVYVAIYFIYIYWGFLSWSLGEGGVRDLIFFLNISFKVLLDMTFGIILGLIIIRNLKLLYLWMIIQGILISLSMISIHVYRFLIYFISSSSGAVFEQIFSLKAIGFGLYHTAGSILFAFSIVFYITLLPRIKFQSFKWILFSFWSMLISRSSILVIIFFGFFKKIKALLFLFILLSFAAFIFKDGVIFRVTEMFRNLIDSGTISTESTNQNLLMFVFPTDITSSIIGYGKFFESGNELHFFKFTDLGVARLSLFGGWVFLFLFSIVNLFWVFYAYILNKKMKSKNLILIAILSFTFIIMLFKDISFISVFGMALFVFIDNKKVLKNHSLSNK